MKILFACLMIVIPQTVFGLSCLAPNLGNEVNKAIASEDIYAVVVGNLKAVEPVNDPYKNREEPTRTKAQVTGGTIGPKGIVPLAGPLNISVELSCIASWCGGFPNDGEQKLIFLKKSAEDWLLSIPACSSSFFYKPTEAEVSIIAKCIRRGKCSDAVVEKLSQRKF